MKKLFDVANQYVRESDWKVIAVLKFCLISLGMMIGMGIKKEYKKPAYLAAGLVFLASYIPLMGKFFRLFRMEE